MTVRHAGSAEVRAVIDRYAGLPFRWGLDCCQFAGECMAAVGGHNPMDGLNYDDEASAQALIDRHGGMRAALLAVFGEPYDGCKNGDVLYVSRCGVEMAGVVYRGRCVVRTQQGLMDWPIEWASLVWES